MSRYIHPANFNSEHEKACDRAINKGFPVTLLEMVNWPNVPVRTAHVDNLPEEIREEYYDN